MQKPKNCAHKNIPREPCAIMLDKNFMWSYILWNHPYVQSYECKWTELPCGTVYNEVRRDSYLYIGIRQYSSFLMLYSR